LVFGIESAVGTPNSSYARGVSLSVLSRRMGAFG